MFENHHFLHVDFITKIIIIIHFPQSCQFTTVTKMQIYIQNVDKRASVSLKDISQTSE